MVKIVGIYAIRNILDNKVYVGKSINITKRFNRHKRSLLLNTQQNKHLQAAWNKYGEKAFVFEIIELCTEAELNSREIYWITRIDSLNPIYGYNKKSGGEGGKLTHDALLRMIKSHIGKKLSREHRKRISMGNLGHSVSQKTRNKIGKAHKGKPKSEEHKKSISNTLLGRVLPLKTRQKMSKARKALNLKDVTCPHCGKIGKPSGMYSYHFTNCKFK
jgi:group I intron endonuclease